MLKEKFFKNLVFEIVNFFAFLRAAIRFRDKRMRMIVRGTLKRQIKVYFFKQKTIKQVENNRKGNCTGCGICCRYIRKCPYLTDKNTCGIYEERHFVCRIYPTSEYDIQLISRISDKKCGFYFKC